MLINSMAYFTQKPNCQTMISLAHIKARRQPETIGLLCFGRVDPPFLAWHVGLNMGSLASHITHCGVLVSRHLRQQCMHLRKK